MTRKTCIFLLLGVFLAGFGCGGGEAPTPTKVPIPPASPKPVAKVPAKDVPKPGAEVRVEPPQTMAYSYNPLGKANPFQPLVVEKPEAPPPAPKKKVEAAEKKEKEEPKTPLERVDLTALKLVAVVWDIPQPRAMVEDSSGRGYILTLGTRVGKNQGEVSKITSAGVIVTEKVEAADGKMRTMETALRLYTDQ
ncbi:MAG: pilus assembly protein PilP [Syntrophaceae bacterium]|jgi:type IV pilus assembly protein PilP|nr:pilus assembly protein PilP [Syntrophaceae bacterium]